MATIAVIGTLDTKGREHQFIADFISQSGHQAHLIDIGTGGEPQVVPYMTRDAVLHAGKVDPSLLKQEREAALAAMSKAVTAVLLKLIEQHKIQGVISLGGGGGTTVATTVMRALPLGFPKVMISTETARDTSKFVGTKDIVLIPSVIDIAGLNRISKPILAKAAGAICGMVTASLEKPVQHDYPLVVTNMCPTNSVGVSAAKRMLEKAGHDVSVFSATGSGGVAMESILDSGNIIGVMDLTISEIVDEMFGGIHSAGPDRMRAAARRGISAVLAPGGADAITFGPLESLPPAFAGRTVHALSPAITLVRTTPAEAEAIGKKFADKANRFTGMLTVVLPTEGVGSLSVPGGPLHNPEADQALFAAIRSGLNESVPLIEVQCGINDHAFSEACASTMINDIKLLKKR